MVFISSQLKEYNSSSLALYIWESQTSYMTGLQDLPFVAKLKSHKVFSCGIQPPNFIVTKGHITCKWSQRGYSWLESLQFDVTKNDFNGGVKFRMEKVMEDI